VIVGDSDSGRPTRGAVPVVSIVVPTHDRPEALSRLLVSLRGLTFPPESLELIVVGGEADRGRDVVQAFAGSVDFPTTYIPVADDALRSASFKRNQGARLARGDILAFTDDDCVVHPDWLTAAVPRFSAPEVGGVEGAVEIPTPKKPTPTYKASQRLSLPEGYQTCNMLYRKSAFVECGGFDLSFPYYMEDTDLAYTVLEHGYTIPFAPDAVVAHPVPEGRPTKYFTMARTVEQMPYLFRKHSQSPRLRSSVRPFNRSHYLYLTIYAAALFSAFAKPVAGAVLALVGLSILLPVQLVRNFWGLHTTAREVLLTALFQPIIPLVRLFYWVKGYACLSLRRAAGSVAI
jgi:GT2 family glycosyltransferase